MASAINRLAGFAFAALALAACGDPDARSDLQKFTDLHKQIVKVEKPLKACAELSQAEMNLATSLGDALSAYKAASQYSTCMMNLDAQAAQIDVPAFQSQDVQQPAQAALDSLRSEIAYRQVLADSLKKTVNEGTVRPSDSVEQGGASYSADDAAASRAASITQGYLALGIKPERIDTEHGGILSPGQEKPGATPPG